MRRKSAVAVSGAQFLTMDKPLRRGKEFSGEHLVLIWDHCALLGDFTPQTICRLLVHGADSASVERSLLRFIRPEKDGRQDVLRRIRGVPRLVEYDREKLKRGGQERAYFKKCVENGRTRKQLAQLFHVSVQRVDEWLSHLGLSLKEQ